MSVCCSGDDIIDHYRGHQLTLPALYSTGFTIPILVETADGLALNVPPPNFSIADVENYVGKLGALIQLNSISATVAVEVKHHLFKVSLGLII